MVENLKAVRRPRGRPQIRPDEETRRLIIEAARHEFQTSGYAQASMASVAQKAGISTKTMYRLIPTKADLFRSVLSDRISRFMLELDPEALDALALEDALERMLVTYGSLTLDGETIAMIQLVIGECDRFPEIAAAFYETAIGRVGDAMEDWLRRQCDRRVDRHRGCPHGDGHFAGHDGPGAAARRDAGPTGPAGSSRNLRSGPILYARIPRRLPASEITAQGMKACSRYRVPGCWTISWLSSGTMPSAVDVGRRNVDRHGKPHLASLPFGCRPRGGSSIAGPT